MNKHIAQIAAFILCLLLVVTSVSAVEPNENTVYIRTVEDIEALAENCRTDTWSKSKTVILENDISLAGVDFTPIRYFSGIFEGNHHTISDVSITCTASPCGIFAELGRNAKILRLNVKGDYFPTGSVDSIGGIAGINSGLIADCTFTGSIEGNAFIGGIVGENGSLGCLEACSAYGSLRGSSMTGGVVGRNEGSILNCVNESYVNITSVDPAVNLNELDIVGISKSLSVAPSDALGVIQDSGGIAGYNSGIIGLCTNRATVGYQQIGYNAGGIAGRSCGYIYSCTNNGEIYGRKDIGGIVGQMEPYVEIRSSADLAANLVSQCGSLTYLLNEASEDAQDASSTAANRYKKMSSDLQPVISSLEGIDMKSPDSMRNAVSSISGALSSLSGSLDRVAGDIDHAGETLSDDAAAINAQLRTISETTGRICNALTNPDKMNVFKDTSDKNIASVTYGKTEKSTNTGNIYGDLNVGGIIGQISVESELSPEKDNEITQSGTVRSEFEYRAIVLKCVNQGNASARRNYVGSICGLADIGVIRSCEGYGSAESESGSYVGGIAGLGRAKIADCWAKCALSGVSFVGGICGCGNDDGEDSSIVTDCYSLVQILNCDQFCGSVSGYGSGKYTNNRFVSDSLQGINGLSLQGSAERMEYEQLLQLKNTPEAFKSFTLTFTADDEVLKVVHFQYGESFDSSVYPSIPEKADCFSSWEDIDLSMVHTDLTVEAVYRHYNTIIASNLVRHSGRSALYAEGMFDEDTYFTVTSERVDGDIPNQYAELNKPWYQQIAGQLMDLIHGDPIDATVCRGLVERLTLHIPDDGQETHTVRYTPPEHISKYRIYLNDGEGLEKMETETVGSYRCFQVSGNTAELVVFSTVRTVWMLLIMLVVVALLALCVWLACRILRKRWLTRLSRKVLKDVEKQTEAITKEKKMTWTVTVCVGLVFLTGIAIFMAVSPLGKAIRTPQKIKALLSVEDQAFHMDVSGTVGSRSLDYNCDMQSVTEEGTEVLCLSMGNAVIYYQGNMVYLPDGTAYSVSASLPDKTKLLPLAVEAYRKGAVQTEFNGDRAVYRLTVSDDFAGEMVQLLIPELAGEKGRLKIDNLTMSLISEQETLQSLTITCTGENHAGTAFRLHAVLTPEEPALTVPTAVMEAIAGGVEPIDTLSADLFRLLVAWVDFDTAKVRHGTVALSADCSSVVIHDQLNYSRCVVDNTPISCLEKNNLAVYFSENGICSASGNTLNVSEQMLADTFGILEVIEDISRYGQISVRTSENTQIFTLNLDEDAVKNIGSKIAPAAAKLDIRYTSGSAVITLRGGQLQSIEIFCGGTLKVVRSEVNADIRANIAFDNSNHSVPAIPEAVKAALVVPKA